MEVDFLDWIVGISQFVGGVVVFFVIIGAPKRYAVQYKTGSSWIRCHRYWFRKTAIKHCERDGKEYKILKHRVFDSKQEKVVFEYGQHWRAVEGDRGRSGEKPCVTCGKPLGPREVKACGACLSSPRTRTRSSLMGLLARVNMLELFGSPIHLWRLEGLLCSCLDIKCQILSTWTERRPLTASPPGYTNPVQAPLDIAITYVTETKALLNVSCSHYDLKKVVGTVCPEHHSIHLGRELTCCIELKNLPKVTGAVRAWRIWKYYGDSYLLSSMVASYTYKPGLNICPHYRPGMSQFRNETEGGFYCFSSLSTMKVQEPSAFRQWEKNRDVLLEDIKGRDYRVVIGSVLCFGGLKVAEHGYRAQKVVPEFLILGHNDNDRYNMDVLKLADKYNMGVITPKEAEKMQAGHIPFTEEQLREIESE